jgi:hypothetical protein
MKADIFLASLFVMLLVTVVHFMTNITPISGSSQSNSTSISPETKKFGAWWSYQLPLESVEKSEQKAAIQTLLNQGYSEYYFPVDDFSSESTASRIDNLLSTTDYTDLKIILVLLPPSEAGHKGNYDWNGWIEYLNSLKGKHPSLDGFVIDDFNWFGPLKHSDRDDDDEDAKKLADPNNIQYNAKFMVKTKLKEALEMKRPDLHFYPLIYIEGAKTNTVKKEFYNLTDGILLASVDYYNVTTLDHNLDVFRRVFDKNLPIRYLIFTAPTSNYTSLGYHPPSDRLILATLSTASSSDAINGGIVIWRNTESHAVTDFLSNRNNSKFLSLISLMKDLQIKDENNTKNIIKTLSSSLENHTNDYGNDDSQKRIKKDKEKDEMGHKSSSSKVWLGVSVTDLTPDLSEDRGLPINSKGIAIQSVFPDSPAYAAGIRGIFLDVDQNGYLITRGDVITSIDGKQTKTVDDLLDILKNKKAGDTIEMTLSRNGNLTNTTVKLEALPS